MLNELVYLIPCFNNAEGLHKTLVSIKESEVINVIIVDDGSKVPIVIEPSAYNNCNIFVLRNDGNKGITDALNIGLDEAKLRGYKYVARVDAGDECLPNRILNQLEYLKTKNLSLCGTYVHFVDEFGSHLFDFEPPVNHGELIRVLKRYNPFIHPSVIYNLDHVLSVGGYPNAYPSLEDWALFMKLSASFKVGIMPEFFINYIVEKNSISTRRRKEQAKSKVKLLRDNFNFDCNSILGLIKNAIILYLPRGFLTNIKRFFLK